MHRKLLLIARLSEFGKPPAKIPAQPEPISSSSVFRLARIRANQAIASARRSFRRRFLLNGYLWTGKNLGTGNADPEIQARRSEVFHIPRCSLRNFDCWNSKHHRWNSVNYGPKRDVVGTWRKIARYNGLRFGVSEHLAWVTAGSNEDLHIVDVRRLGTDEKLVWSRNENGLEVATPKAVPFDYAVALKTTS